MLSVLVQTNYIGVKMKRIFLGVCLLVMILGISCVSAADLTEHDFKNFTMNVPSDASFDQVIPVGVSWTPVGSSTLKPDYNNSCWSDGSELLIEFSNDNYKDVIKSRLSEAKESGDESGLHIYDISGCKNSDGHNYAVCKELGKSVVIVYGNDLDSLKEMASTAKIN